MRAWMFPGQGSQRRGMGTELFPRYPAQVAQANEVLGYDIAELCERDPENRLRQTQFAQPALFVVNALTYLDRLEQEAAPDILAGHSLGEYNALWAAGCFDFATGIRLVKERGSLMAQASGGGMTAVVGLDAARVAELLETQGLGELDIANFNEPQQVVLSGPQEALRKAAEIFGREAGARCVPLNVSAPFHSRYMAPAAERFAAFLGGFTFAAPQIPVIANVTARPYPVGGVADLLAQQIRKPVRWWDSVIHLRDRGVEHAVEIGPGNVLTRIWEKAPPLLISAAGLGSAAFRADYGIKYAYLAGSMYQGIASVDLVVRLARAGLMGFFGAGGLKLDTIDEAITAIQRELGPDGRFGANLLYTLDDGSWETSVAELYLRRGLRFIEAAGYTKVTEPVVRFRFTGAHRDASGRPVAVRSVVAKVSRPETAEAFLSPPPQTVLDKLIAAGHLTAAEAAIARELPVSDDICVESDSGGHTDAGVALTLVPSLIRLRDELAQRYGYPKRPRVGAAGGIGTPEAVAAAFILGAEFVVTGSVNQCSPQAGTSDEVKDVLATLDVQDTTYAPAGDMFELGARVQVVRKGTLFAARANRLYQLYRQHDSLDEIDPHTRKTLEETYFRRSFEEVWQQTRDYLAQRRPDELARAEGNPKHRMALVFRWYFVHSAKTARLGHTEERVNYQIHSGPAIGAFNRFVAGTKLADWRHRHVDAIADKLMGGGAALLSRRYHHLIQGESS